MPKEHIRKRGKRKPKTDGFDAPAPAAPAPAPVAPVDRFEDGDAAAAGGIHPSRLAFLKTGVRPAPQETQAESAGYSVPGEGEGEEGGDGEGAANWTRLDRTDSEFPFGVLDPDVKAYFRNVEEQIKDWEGVAVGDGGEEREDRQIFLSSVLSELRGHELQVATDAETSIVFERLLPSLNDWGRRVVGDAVGENWQTLIRHRFGSHVAQTWMSLAAGTLDREARGVFPPQHVEQAAKGGDEGTLPTMGELITSVVECIMPTLPSLLVSPHASPVIRLLILVLTPNRALPSLDGADGAGDLVRSKRSGKFRKGQNVQGKSILGDDSDDKGKKSATRKVPAEVAALRARIRTEVCDKLSGVEWQGMGVDKVGSAAVQLLLEVEVEDGEGEKKGSLLDTLTEGLVSHLESSDEPPKPQPYLSGILVSPTGTRLLEALLKLSPARIFAALWSAYFVGKIGKWAGHPFANFVVAAGVTRLDGKQVRAAIKEIKSVSGGKPLIKMARTSVLLAMADRAAGLSDKTQTAVVSLVESALDLGEHKGALVPALMALKTFPMYEALRTGADMPADEDDPRPADVVDADAEAQAAADARRHAWENRRNAQPKGKLEPNMQGCLLLQSLLGLQHANTVILDSLFAQSADTLLSYASSPIASHLLDKVLTSSAVPPKYRRKLFLAFMGKYDALATDRLGSRVADTVWATADGFMKEKIARSLIPHATILGNDRYGRYVVRKMELHLLQRRPDEWREAMIGVKHHFAHEKEQQQTEVKGVEAEAKKEGKGAEGETAEEAEKRRKKEKKDRKRKERERDAIDDVFEMAKKAKKERA